MAFIEVFLLVVTIFMSTFIFFINGSEFLWRGNPPHPPILDSSYLSAYHLLLVRVALGWVVWASCLIIYFDEEGLALDVATRDKKVKRVVLRGLERFSPFTVWSWALIGWYMFFVSLAGFAEHFKNDALLAYTSTAAYKYLCLVLFEVSFSAAFLVSSIVTYVLIPICTREGVPVAAFYRPFSLLFHNANVVIMATECLLNKLLFNPYHFIFVVMYGTTYVVFSWFWFQRKGIFYYFFLDYSHKFALALHVGLICCVATFFFLGWGISSLRGAGVAAQVGIVAITGLCMKLRQ
jgi:hypothetical protein